MLVALRKESVDRNASYKNDTIVHSMSLSARRAWIEIIVRKRQERLEKCRSPQGERG